MGTGLIYAAIVVVWAAYLVPLALRRYDEATRTRSIDTFSNAMRVLGRRDNSRAAQMVAPARPLASPRVLTPPQKSEPAVEAPRPNPRAGRLAAQRRRRTLLVLLGVTALVTALAALSLLPWWTVAVPVALVVAWLFVCRIQVSRMNNAAWEHAATTVKPKVEPAKKVKKQRAIPAVRRAVRVNSSYGSGPAPLGDDPDDEPTVVISAAELIDHPHPVEVDAAPVAEEDLREETVAAVAVATSDGGSLWDPLPVTLPTYVSKPRAARTVRSIEFGEPGAWTSGHVEGEETELPAAPEENAHQRAVGD